MCVHNATIVRLDDVLYDNFVIVLAEREEEPAGSIGLEAERKRSGGVERLCVFA